MDTFEQGNLLMERRLLLEVYCACWLDQDALVVEKAEWHVEKSVVVVVVVAPVLVSFGNQEMPCNSGTYLEDASF